MKDVLATAGIFVVGVLLGHVAKRALPPPSAVSTPEAASTVSAPSQAPLARARRDCPTPPPDLDEHRLERLQAVMLEARLLEARRQEREGTPSDWRPDPGSSFAAPRFSSSLHEALEDDPSLSLLELDCSELPCVASIARRRDPDDDVGLGPYRGVHRALGMEEGASLMATTGVIADSDGMWEAHTLTFLPQGVDPELERRAAYRLNMLSEASSAYPPKEVP